MFVYHLKLDALGIEKDFKGQTVHVYLLILSLTDIFESAQNCIRVTIRIPKCTRNGHIGDFIHTLPSNVLV